MVVRVGSWIHDAPNAFQRISARDNAHFPLQSGAPDGLCEVGLNLFNPSSRFSIPFVLCRADEGPAARTVGSGHEEGKKLEGIREVLHLRTRRPF
jgi:hypothetical protein